MANLRAWFLANGGDESSYYQYNLNLTVQGDEPSSGTWVAKARKITARAQIWAKSAHATARSTFLAVCLALSSPTPRNGQTPSPVVAKTARDPDASCPTCGSRHLYTDYYDQCYECGRGIVEESP